MPTLTITPNGRFRDGQFIPAASRKVTVSVDKPADRFEMNANAPRSRAQAAKYGATDEQLIAAADAALSTGQVQTLVVADPETPGPNTYRLVVRDFQSSTGANHDVPAEGLLSVLASVPQDKLLCWTDAPLACLDVDYHDTPAPPPHHLLAWMQSIAPKPILWHLSRGGGLHLFYVDADGFTAEELACAAALRYRHLDPTAGVELKKQVRGPGTAECHTRSAQDTTAGLGSWLDATETPDPTEWLENNNMEMGGRYDHDRCPIDPTEEPGQRQPVTVGEAGVYCHRCAGKGFTFGSRKPGFVPWSALCGDKGGSVVGAMVRGFVHWGHAKWVLVHKYGLPEALAEPAYRAALKAHHGAENPRIVNAFLPDTRDIARNGDSWVNIESGTVYQGTGVNALLAALPAAQMETEKGPKAVPATVAYLYQPHSLEPRGYVNVVPVQGYRLAAQYLPAVKDTHISILSRELRGSPRAPQYVPGGKRKPLAWAMEEFEKRFPKISWVTIRTLICALASAQETKLGLQPLLFVSGGTGVAKTTHCKLAAGIVGANATEVVYRQDEDKFKRAIKHAGSESCIVMANEFLKEAARANGRFDARAAMEPFLTLTPDTSIHVMHVGPRKLGRIPAIVVTEPNCPYMLRGYQQIARRFRQISLYHRKDSWKASFADMGLSNDSTHLFRVADAVLAEASDVILSDIIDRFFCVPMSWDDMADQLGVPALEHSPEFENPGPKLRRFFRLVCSAPETTDPRVLKNYHKSYRRIHRTDQGVSEAESELYDMWTLFADRGWFSSSELTEKNWSDFLGTDEPVLLDIKSDNSTAVYVRFRQGPLHKPLRTNGDIKVNLPPEDEE